MKKREFKKIKIDIKQVSDICIEVRGNFRWENDKVIFKENPNGRYKILYPSKTSGEKL
jgi:hypothetical protein